MAELHISSLLVHGLPQCAAGIRDAIAGIQGAEIALADPGGKMVVTVEASSQSGVADALAEISRLDGVLSAVLVYHHVDQAEP